MRLFPLTPSAAQAAIVSSGGLGDLTSAQLALIQEGTFVTTSDGKRWQYDGTGDKTSQANYILISDETPEWSTIENVPIFTSGTPGIVPNSIGSSVTKFLKGDGTWSDPTPTIDQVQGLTNALAGKQPAGSYAALPTDSSHSFSQSGQSLALQPARAQFVRVTMSFANGSASVQLPSSGQNYDEVIVDANVGANCTLTVGSVELANTNQYYGIGRRLLRFVRKNNVWNLYEHPYHTHTTNELIFAAAPQVATSPGRAGTISYAAGNLYVAVADNQWRRVALATW